MLDQDNQFPHSTLVNNLNSISPERLGEGLKGFGQQKQIFPSSFTFLLENQSKHIKQIKAKLKIDKDKIDQDLYVFKNQLFNMLDDLRLSLHAHLDNVYKNFLQKYSAFKAELQQAIHLKNRYVNTSDLLNRSREFTNVSKNRYNSSQSYVRQNNATISEMQYGNHQLKNYQIAEYMQRLQKQKIYPLINKQRQIISIIRFNNGYYHTQQFCQIMGKVKQKLSRQFSYIYQKGVYKFITNIDQVSHPQNQKVLDLLQDRFKAPQPSIILKHPYFHQITRNNPNPPIFGYISPSQQSVRVQWAEKVGIYFDTKYSIDRQYPLCGLTLNNSFIFGCRNGSICVRSRDGLHIATVLNHRASVCCLALIKINNITLLASGSDHGCNSIIIWDTSNWKPIDRFDNHKAAISSILDLQDNRHVLSTSYDKSVNVFDLQAGKLHFTLSENSPVVGAAINKSATRVIAISLNKSAIIWHVVRNQGKVQSMFLQRKIDIDSMGCSITASSILNQLVFIGAKDGKLRALNTEKGQVQSTISCCKSHIVEILLIQRQSRPRHPIALIWQFKTNSIFIVNTADGNIMIQNWPGFVQFCCGVNPKCFFFKKGSQLGIISHNNDCPDFTLCRIQEDK